MIRAEPRLYIVSATIFSLQFWPGQTCRLSLINDNDIYRQGHAFGTSVLILFHTFYTYRIGSLFIMAGRATQYIHHLTDVAHRSMTFQMGVFLSLSLALRFVSSFSIIFVAFCDGFHWFFTRCRPGAVYDGVVPSLNHRYTFSLLILLLIETNCIVVESNHPDNVNAEESRRIFASDRFEHVHCKMIRIDIPYAQADTPCTKWWAHHRFARVPL